MKKIIRISGKIITVIHKKTTVSTNTDALEQAVNTLVIADRQIGGKGRLGRSFVSPIGGVYMSISVNAEYSAARLTTSAAAAAARAIEDIGGGDVKIKWVNDLYIENKKVCGILAASKAQNGKPQAAVVGIGVNLVEKQPFDETLSDKAGYVFKRGNFRRLRKKFINIFLQNFFALLEDSADTIFNEYTARDYLFGKTVGFVRESKQYKGQALGFDKKINLLVRCGETVVSLESGEANIISF